MDIIDLTAQVRLLRHLPRYIGELHAQVTDARAGDITRPHELAPLAVQAHELSIQCLDQLVLLSTSQYAVMRDGRKNLALFAHATRKVSAAAALCERAITARSDAILGPGARRHPDAAAGHLAGAAEELRYAAGIYRVLASSLTRRLSSAPAQAEDQRRIDRVTQRAASLPPTRPAMPAASLPRSR
ncbi:hypothetical protein AB0C52_25075 [Streptomyces sp. NPDC048717]|uniref:hypothetical protein n=1 Tax=unclassified Streptomyces TaxID=2593676 RepID=UPI003444E177